MIMTREAGGGSERYAMRLNVEDVDQIPAGNLHQGSRAEKKINALVQAWLETHP